RCWVARAITEGHQRCRHSPATRMLWSLRDSTKPVTVRSRFTTATRTPTSDLHEQISCGYPERGEVKSERSPFTSVQLVVQTDWLGRRCCGGLRHRSIV